MLNALLPLLAIGNLCIVLALDTPLFPITSLNSSVPGWAIVPGNTSERICSGEGYVSSITQGSYYWYQFRGTNVSAYFLQADDAAILEVSIDDTFQARINPYNAAVTSANSCVLYEYDSPILPWTQHKITVYHRGNAPQVTGDSYMRINKFISTAPDVVTGSSSSSSTTSSSLSSSVMSSSTTSSATSLVTTVSSPPPIGAIVGGVVGGLLGFVLLVFLLWAVFWRKAPPPPDPSFQGQENMAYTNVNRFSHPTDQFLSSPHDLPNLGFTGDATGGAGDAELGKGAGQDFTYTSSPVHEEHASGKVAAPITVDISPSDDRQTTPWTPDRPRSSSFSASPASEHSPGSFNLPSFSQTSTAFSLPNHVQNRLSSQQLQTIQRMTEQNVPGETLTAVINSMLAEAGVTAATAYRQGPPSYRPTL